jgi:thiol-disulfide isomerase/thioredoxin
MPTSASVVTAARFEQGLPYPEFMRQLTVNRDKFEQYYRESPITAEDLDFFKHCAETPGGPANVLAIGEDWCGDVYRELPTVARICEFAGMDLRVFPRDKNPDIMDEFLSNDGKARAIPVFVFYTDEMRYITRFVERPKTAQAEIDALLDEVKTRVNLPKTATFTDLAPPEKKEVIARIMPRFEQWQKDSIAEMRDLLARALQLENA